MKTQTMNKLFVLAGIITESAHIVRKNTYQSLDFKQNNTIYLKINNIWEFLHLEDSSSASDRLESSSQASLKNDRNISIVNIIWGEFHEDRRNKSIHVSFCYF